MLDHVFTDAIGALREALERALLERKAIEERFHSDVLLGDLSWETSYSLPGEPIFPRVRADLSLDWPTWSQTAYRSWYLDGDFDEPPHIDITVVMRLQRLVLPPNVAVVMSSLDAQSPAIGAQMLARSAPTVETAFDSDAAPIHHAFEVSYEGTYELSEAALEDGALIDQHFAAMGVWIASVLVRLGDSDLEFLPSD